MNILEKIKQIVRKITGKAPKALAAGATIAAVGLATGCGADKEVEPVDNNVKVEATKDFKEQYKVDVNTQQSVKQKTEEDIRQDINDLETEQEVYDYIKDLYVECHEMVTGDTTLTTADIESIIESHETYVYIDQATGQMISHGRFPGETEQKMNEAGVSYEVKENVTLYKVLGTDGREIDCVRIEEREKDPIKVISGDRYGQPYITVLDKMKKDTLKQGIKYASFIEGRDENAKGVSKGLLTDSVIEFEKSKENQNLIAEKESEYGE